MVLHQHARAWYCRRKHWQHQAGSGSEPFPLPHVKKDREREDTAVWLQCAPVATMDRGVYLYALENNRFGLEAIVVVEGSNFRVGSKARIRSGSESGRSSADRPTFTAGRRQCGGRRP